MLITINVYDVCDEFLRNRSQQSNVKRGEIFASEYIGCASDHIRFDTT